MLNFKILCIFSIFVQLCQINCFSVDEINTNTYTMEQEAKLDTIILGAGCFWCVEAVFQQLNGVEHVVPGYAGGFTSNPTYEEVCSESTGHAEVAKITFDNSKISLSKLLEVFFMTHDPTTLNRQGNDVGTQYRSAIFCVNKEQYQLAKLFKAKIDESSIWPNPVVTEIEMLDEFYEAENYHHNYYNNNKNQGYCQYVIFPKIEKFKKIFSSEIKVK